jgi:hypothetical protein
MIAPGYPSPSPEPFVPAEVAANFLGIKRRLLLAMARRGFAGSYPVGTGDFRKVWVFRIGELEAALTARVRR